MYQRTHSSMISPSNLSGGGRLVHYVGASARQKLFERHHRIQHSLAPLNEVFFHRLCQSSFDPRRQRPKTAFEKPVQEPSLTHEDALAFALAPALEHPREFPLLPQLHSP